MFLRLMVSFRKEGACAGIAVGKLVEKIERMIRRKEDEENNMENKNDRR